MLDLQAELKKALAERDIAIGERDAYQSRTVELATEVEGWQGKLAAAEQGYATDRAFTAAGIADEQVRDMAQYLYGKLPEESRPSLADWVASETGARAHPLIVPHLATVQPAATQPAQAQAPAAPPPANPEAGAHAAPPPAILDPHAAADARLRQARKYPEGSAEYRKGVRESHNIRIGRQTQ